MRIVIVIEGFHERMLFEYRLHDSTLDASAPAVNQAHLEKASRMGRSNILIYN
jgi:hypothetical protein